MKIGIDLTPLTYRLTGVGVYVKELFSAMSSGEPEFCWRFPIEIEIPAARILRLLMQRNISSQTLSKVVIEPHFALFHNRRQRETTLTKPYDLFHITNAQCQYTQFSMPMVITVHDLAWMRVPRNEMPAPRIFGLNRLERLIKSARHVICDSECTRNDVIEFIGRSPEDVTTIHLAQRTFCRPPLDEQQRLQARKIANRGIPYFLAVSTIEPRKNYVRLIKAFAQLQEEHPDVHLVIAGAKRSAWNDVREAIQTCGVSSKVHALGHVSDVDVLQLLWGCEALVYPSLYEGFGLPALEAMACGTPVIASAAGSLGEVVSAAAVIVDPLDVDSIAEGMRSVMGSRDLRVRLCELSIARASEFSWRKTAEKTIDVYRNVIG